ncbi:hypothetical protein C8J56DRAFT_1126265 [Mycena floridula]|nr:hypothetical protein C8J56DRAFT_1126265 [Mycena floridula]
MNDSIVRLSDDLLCEIFFSLLDDWKHDSNSYNRGSTGNVWEDGDAFMDILIALNLPQLSITHICRHWRQIAMALPRFWSSYFVSVRGDNAQFGHIDIGGRIVALDKWMERSEPLVVNVAVHCINWDVLNLEGLVVALMSYSHRWRELKLSIPEKFFQSLHTMTAVPNLERKAFIAWEEIPDSRLVFQPAVDFAWVASAPRLSHISFDQLSASSTVLPALPCNQLQSLSLSCQNFGSYNMCSTSFLNILRISPNLVSFSLFMPGTEFQDNESRELMDGWVDGTQVSAVKLEHLELHLLLESDHVKAADILSSLIALNLTSLTLPGGAYTDIAVLAAFADRSRFALKVLRNLSSNPKMPSGDRLSMSGKPPDERFASCRVREAGYEPNLQHDDPEIFRSLEIQSGARMVCPKLHVLHVDRWENQGGPPEPGPILALLRTRTYAKPGNVMVALLDNVYLGSEWDIKEYFPIEEGRSIEQCGTKLTLFSRE